MMKKKLSIIPMGVHVELFQTKVNLEQLKSKYEINAKITLLFIGRLADKKGIQYIIKAMVNITSKNNDVNLIICGDGPLRKELQQQVKYMKLENFVRFTGFISDNEKIDYLRLSDILIVPSIVTDSGDTEGLPVVILEGLAAGKPIIASDVSGVKDVIKDGWNGFLIEQKNPEQIVDKIFTLINTPATVNQFSKNSITVSEKYDWCIIGKMYEIILTEIR